MKKINTLFVVLAGTLSLTSCSKDLKNDARRLNEELNQLEAANDSLKDRINQTSYVLHLDAPANIKTILTNNEGKQAVFERQYLFKQTNTFSHCMVKNANGSYDIRIIRYLDPGSSEYCRLQFTYDPSTKLISDKSVVHYWLDPIMYEAYIEYRALPNTAGLTIDITVESINTSTGEIALTAKAAGTGEYTKNANAPYPGQPISTTLSFKGRLEVMLRD